MSTVNINGSCQLGWHLESNGHQNCHNVTLLYRGCHTVISTDYQIQNNTSFEKIFALSKNQNAYISKCFHLFWKIPIEAPIFGTKYSKTDQVKTAFKIFEGIWSAKFWRLSSTNITSFILEYFVPFIKNRLYPDYPNNNLFPLVWKIKSKTNFWRFNQ